MTVKVEMFLSQFCLTRFQKDHRDFKHVEYSSYRNAYTVKIIGTSFGKKTGETFVSCSVVAG